MKVPEEKADEKENIEKLQMLEQNTQQYQAQRQQFQSQLVEVESALKELKTSEESYKIIGNIMVKGKREDLEKDLSSRKEMYDLRIKNLEKQETKLREKAKELQEQVMESMKDGRQ